MPSKARMKAELEAELEAELKVELGKKAEQLAKKGLVISPSTPPHQVG